MSRAPTVVRSGASDKPLPRVVGVGGAVLMGLGSILGTGIFVSIGIAAGITGPSVLLAIALGGVVAVFNGLSSAQLAASHPVSGGTYEYGYRYLNPTLGFTAGWMFLCAKSASAATAALGFSGYLLGALGSTDQTGVRVAVALTSIVVLTVIVASGMTRSSRANILIVGLTLGALLTFVAFGLPTAARGAGEHIAGFFPRDERPGNVKNLLHATALMFVAYTGYGRIATLGEEVREPQKSIPRAMIITLLCTMGIYAAVAFVAVASVGATALAAATEQVAAPLEMIAHSFETPGVAAVVALGAMTAMLGVLLNLLLGLSRVVLAMSRRGDLPRALGDVNAERSSPRAAVYLVGGLVALLAASGSVKTTWSFSAFTVLVYYALTNWAALKLPPAARLYPVWIPWLGLGCCLGLAFWVEPSIWVTGLGLIGLGVIWHRVAQRASAPRRL